MADRKPRKEKIVVDLTKPVKLESTDNGCFGNEWDISTTECSQCADREICGILFRDVLKKREAQIQAKLPTPFLDKADFDFSEARLLAQIESGTTTAKELIEIVSGLSNCGDVDSCVRWIKDWVPSRKLIQIKNGIVWRR